MKDRSYEKTTPNAHWVALDILDSINDPLNEEDLI